VAARGRRTRRWTLRLRLTLVTAGLLCVALVVGAVALTTVLSRTRVAALDDVVVQRADTVAELAADDRLPTTLPVAQPGEIVQLLDASGRVLATSPTASATLPVLPADEVAELRARAPWVGSTTDCAYDDEARAAVRATTWHDQPATVVATVPMTEVRGLLHALTLALLGVVPVLTAMFAVAIWFALGRALEPALARQRTFVGDAAHELRSPIASLRAAVDVARAHPQAYAADELAADLDGDLTRMQALVDDLLLLARLGSTTRRPVEVDLAEVAREVARSVGVRAVVRMEVVGSGTGTADPDAVARVVRNLVDNAVRHARSRVVVTVAPGAVTVDDDGSGIPAADRERVFERFVRLDEARVREGGGSGLGLAIARELARDGGGDLTLGDSDLGGLRACLRL